MPKSPKTPKKPGPKPATFHTDLTFEQAIKKAVSTPKKKTRDS